MPLLLALLGALAAGALRYRTEKSLQKHSRRPTHWGPFTLNFLGCLLLGALAGWAYRHGRSDVSALLGGAVVAFSVCGYETVRLAGSGRLGAALLTAAGGWVIGTAAAAVGVFLVVA